MMGRPVHRPPAPAKTREVVDAFAGQAIPAGRTSEEEGEGYEGMADEQLQGSDEVGDYDDDLQSSESERL